MWMRSKQPNWVRLLKQVKESEFEYLEYGVEKIRPKSYKDTVIDGIYWDRPPRTLERNWKKHRKTQYKSL